VLQAAEQFGARIALVIEEALGLVAPPLRELHDPPAEPKLIHAVPIGLSPRPIERVGTRRYAEFGQPLG
jgi:hypothetical protein